MMTKKLFAGALILFTLTACQNPVSDEAQGNHEETKMQEEDVTHIEDNREIDEFYGYWTNQDYFFYLNDKTLYIQNLTNDYLHSYDYTNAEINENALSIDLGEGREEKSISLLDEHSTLTLTHDGTLHLSDGNLQDDPLFYPLDEEGLEGRLVEFVDSDGERGPFAYQGEDLSMEDFSGYWVPMENVHLFENVMTPLGNYSIWLGDPFTSVGYYASSLEIAYVHEYEITGNILTTIEEPFISEEISSFEVGLSETVNRYKIKTSYVLYPEEDRDRLISLSSGQVLQRATTPEIIEHFYSDTTDKVIEIGSSYLETVQGLEEHQYQLTEMDNTDETINYENYPYSIGDLSEKQLYEEKQIIAGEIPHPEQSIDTEEAISVLLTNTYESTPSFKNLNYVDEGYYFATSNDRSLLTHGYGGRTSWGPGQSNLVVEDAQLEDHVFTVQYYNAQTDSRHSEQYYRLSQDIIYAQDEAGEFTRRFERFTSWADFHNLSQQVQ